MRTTRSRGSPVPLSTRTIVTQSILLFFFGLLVFPYYSRSIPVYFVENGLSASKNYSLDRSASDHHHTHSSRYDRHPPSPLSQCLISFLWDPSLALSIIFCTASTCIAMGMKSITLRGFLSVSTLHRLPHSFTGWWICDHNIPYLHVSHRAASPPLVPSSCSEVCGSYRCHDSYLQH